MMLKKALSLILCLCLLVSLMLTSVHVEAMTYTSSATTILTISSSGKVTATASVSGYQSSVTKVIVYLYIQQYKNGNWVYVQSITKTFNTYKGACEISLTGSKNAQYRTLASYYTYSGSKYENIVRNSPTKTY